MRQKRSFGIFVLIGLVSLMGAIGFAVLMQHLLAPVASEEASSSASFVTTQETQSPTESERTVQKRSIAQMQEPLPDIPALKQKAEAGDAKAQFDLGLLYVEGIGMSHNEAKAVEWWRKAADQGDRDAQYSLGILYYSGRGVKQDYTEAAKWFEKASQQGFKEAQHMLGVMYLMGRGGLPKNHEKARELF
ncbi:sel1 repeat family protein [Acetobacteraceae bacterium]|nr:sel1 repeat family protein [Acetobacteraceae bacterium]